VDRGIALDGEKMKILRKIIYVKLGKSLSWTRSMIASQMLKKNMSSGWSTGRVRSGWRFGILSRDYHSGSWTGSWCLTLWRMDEERP
jgi:hypothetical protein